MKVNELRLGNLIFSKETQQVETITTISDECITFNSITFDYPVIEEIESIPLTEEWLLKFEFEKELDSIYRKNQSHMIEFVIYDEGILCTSQSVCLNKIKSVHQLQNLYFALAGEELKI